MTTFVFFAKRIQSSSMGRYIIIIHRGPYNITINYRDLLTYCNVHYNWGFPFIIFCFHKNRTIWNNWGELLVNFWHILRNSKRIYQTEKKISFWKKKKRKTFYATHFCGSLIPRIYLKRSHHKLVSHQG